MKICLIRPPILCPKSHPIVQMTPPIGLAYVAGSLKEAGYEVNVIDGLAESFETRHDWGTDCFLYGLSLEQVLDAIEPDTDVVGVSAAFSFEWPVCRELIKQIRGRFPNVRLIGGGEHITAMPELSMEESPLDAGVLGEGEEVTVNLVRAFENGESDLKGINGIIYRTGDGELVRTERHSRIRELDDIARPAWESLPIKAYLDRGFGFGVTRGRSMPVIASRGCPYQCTFCSNPKMWTTRWVVRSVDNMLDELEYYQKTYGAQNFDFYDLTAIVKKAWIVEFCNKIEERGMKFTWQLPSGTRSEAIDEEVAQLLYKSGCRNLSYSPESGSPTVLTRIKKKIKTESMLDSLRSTVGAGMNIKLNIMFGFPGETYKEIRESMKFIAQMAWAGGHDLSIWAFSPYPGSELFDQLYQEGKIKMDDAYYDDLRSYSDMSRCKSFSEHIDNKTLMRLRWLGTVLFYGVGWLRRPWRPFRMLWNGYTGRHESRSDLMVTSMLRRMKLGKKSNKTV